MDKNKKAIILGGTIPHISLIENLGKRGYYTILVDYYENPPAKSSADEHVRESTLDKDKVLEIANNREVDLVISTSIDQANVTACYVSEKMNLPRPYSLETALEVTSKPLLKKKLIDNNIPTSKFSVIESYSELDISEINFPVVVKPSDSTGSKGVRLANSKSELKLNFDQAFQISRTKQVVVEEYVEGKEIQVDFIVQKGEAKLIMTRDKHSISIDEKVVLQSLGSTIPSSMNVNIVEKVQATAQQIVDVFKLENTVLFIQGIVTGNKINVVEFACRIGGGLSYSMIQHIKGIDIISTAIDLCLGNEVNLDLRESRDVWGTTLLYGEKGCFSKIQGLSNLKEKKSIVEYYIFKTEGMAVEGTMTSSDRIGGFLVKANNKKDLKIKRDYCLSNIMILDHKGIDLIKKDIYRW